MKRLAVVLLAACSGIGCAKISPAPAPTKPLSAAADAFQGALQKELQTAMAHGGPVEAVAVCADRAPKLRADTERDFGVHLGRASTRRRNPSPAAPPWVTDWLAANPNGGAGIDDGARLLRPLLTGDVCLKCHGDPTTFSPELRNKIDSLYPNDRATGFKAGELRGVLWASRDPEGGAGK